MTRQRFFCMHCGTEIFRRSPRGGYPQQCANCKRLKHNTYVLSWYHSHLKVSLVTENRDKDYISHNEVRI